MMYILNGQSICIVTLVLLWACYCRSSAVEPFMARKSNYMPLYSMIFGWQH